MLHILLLHSYDLVISNWRASFLPYFNCFSKNGCRFGCMLIYFSFFCPNSFDSLSWFLQCLLKLDVFPSASEFYGCAPIISLWKKKKKANISSPNHFLFCSFELAGWLKPQKKNIPEIFSIPCKMEKRLEARPVRVARAISRSSRVEFESFPKFKGDSRLGSRLDSRSDRALYTPKYIVEVQYNTITNE